MKERPIIFSAESVQAILRGTKTQTRRVIKPRPPYYTGQILGPEWYAPVKYDRWGEMYPGADVFGAYDDSGEWGARCPYGAPGDRLWVKEVWAVSKHYDATKPRDLPDDTQVWWCDATRYNVPDGDWQRGRWRSPLHMMPWASRLTLEVTSVRVERVQEISRADAIAEGVFNYPANTPAEQLFGGPVEDYGLLWDSLNAKRGYPWASNPWVWVVGFRRID